ncbi:MAG: hypothetical protein AAB538_00475 [Patescibacteria group bacterium]|mgnify:CR=1 FL=1
MVMQILLLVLASFLGSGVLFAHRRILTYLAAAGILFEVQWLALTLLDRTLFQNIEMELVFWVGSILALILWAVHYKKFSFPALDGGEMVAVVVTLAALTAAFIVFEFNTLSLFDWKTHGFFNGDTSTLIAITQKSFLTNGLVQENPFAGNGVLEYPSLLHGGLATFFSGVSGGTPLDWYRFLPLLTYLQIVLTVPMFFLLWDAVYPEPAEGWKMWFGVPSRWAILILQGVLVLYVMALSWESFVYPQGHFFLAGVFLLMAALLATSWGGKMREMLPQLGLAVVVGLVLLFSNAVTGTAAVLLKVVFDGLHVIKRGQPVITRLGWGVGVLFWVVMFFLFTPGNGSLGAVPWFSYTAAVEMGRLAPMLILVAIGIFLVYERKLFVSAAAVGMMVLALITFVFSAREIVVENASRFFYHAVLLAFPLALSPLIQSFYWFRREFVLSSRLTVEKIVGWGTAFVLLAIFLLPAGTSVGSAHDNLMFKDEQVISAAMQEAMDWVAHNTDSTAIFLTSPDAPFLVPMLTGRAQLRSGFWLSPDDRALADVQAAFAGSQSAQEMVASQADYLLLQGEERTQWGSLGREPIFRSPNLLIYTLR